MLVLSRKIGERLVIGSNIILTINRVAGNRVTFGIEAPPKVSIKRGELVEVSKGDAIRPIRICSDGTTPPVVSEAAEAGS